jgi:hypothetical protein
MHFPKDGGEGVGDVGGRWMEEEEGIEGGGREEGRKGGMGIRMTAYTKCLIQVPIPFFCTPET